MKRSVYSLFYQIISVLILLICLLGTIYYVRARKDQTMNVDEASELILGRQLAQEGKLITKNWYYSTELRVLNTNIFYSLFFRLTDSWHRVWLFSNISMYVIFLFIYVGLSYSFKFTKYAAISAAAFFIPFSIDYYDIVLRGTFYIPHITITFFVLILSELYLKTFGWKSVLLLLFSIFFSILAGLGGARQLLILYIPLIITAILMFFVNKKQFDTKKYFVYALSVFLASVIGYLINSQVFIKEYHFKTWDDTNFMFFNSSRFTDILNSFLSCFGYSENNVFSFSLLRNGLSFLWFILTVYALVYAIKNKEKISGEYFRFSVFTASVYVIFILFYSFTDASFSDRYSLPVIILTFPLTALLLKSLNKKILSCVFSMLVIIMAFSGMVFYRNSWNIDYYEDFRQISKSLISQGYYNGYSYFANANPITAISNGQIDIWDFTENIHHPNPNNFFDVDRMTPWLQLVRHDYQHPDGKVFVLFSSEEYEEHPLKDHFQSEKIIYQSFDHVVFGYDDYYDMIDNLYPGYDFVFDGSMWMENGADENGHRKLYVGGVSHGPYETFWPGNYMVTIKGNGFDNAAVFCIADYGEKQFEFQMEKQTDEEMVLTFDLAEKTYVFETIIRNMSDVPDSVVDLASVSIKRCPKGICIIE